MNDLSSKPSGSQKPDLSTTGQTSPKTTLTTMLLLIAGLLLASIMMLHYSAPGKGTAEDPLFDLSTTLEKAKTYTTLLKTPKESRTGQSAEIAETNPLGNTSWFGNKTSKVRWPKLKLTGFGTATDNKGGFAILNGKHVHLEQLIDGKAKLVQIRLHDVVVEYKGETKTLTIDSKN